MAGFAHDVAGGNGVLIVSQIQSPNFSLAGQTGWAILKNGDAYFFNVTVKGTIVASVFLGTDFEIDSSGAFFYNGTPAAGNLTASITSAGGTDSHGNHYQAGVTGYQVVPSGPFAGTHAVSLTKTSGVLLGGNWPAVTFTNETSAPYAPPFVGGQAAASGGAEVVLASGEDTSGDTQAYLYLASQHVVGETNGTASLQAGLTQVGPNGTLSVDDNHGTLILGQALLSTPANPGNAAVFSDTNDYAAYVAGLDGQKYNLGHTEVSADLGQVINSTSFSVVTNTTFNVEVTSYRLTYTVFYQGGQAAGAPVFRVQTSPGGLVSFLVQQYRYTTFGSPATIDAGQFLTLNTDMTGPTLLNGTVQMLEVEVWLTFNATGTVSLIAAEGTNGDTFTINQAFGRMERRQ